MSDSEHELLSAYLDDELSAEERARVEELLASREDLRRLLEELQVVRRTMRSLQPLKLNRDLAPAVISRAEQSVLEGPRSGGGPESAPVRDWLARGGRRRWLWPAAAIAAALLIAFFERRQPDQNEVAFQVPRAQPEERPSRDAAGQVAQKRERNESQPETMSELARPAAPASAPPSMSARVAEQDERPTAKLADDKLNTAAPAANLAIPGPVEVNVDPAVLRDRRLEQLLAENGIEFERSASKDSRDQVNDLALPVDEAAGQEYVVYASREQLTPILAKLVERQEPERLSRGMAAEQRGAVGRQLAAEAGGAAAKPAGIIVRLRPTSKEPPANGR